MDGRYADLVVAPVVTITDHTSDDVAQSYRLQEGLRHIHRSLSGRQSVRCTHIDWPLYLRGLEMVDALAVDLRERGRRLAGVVEALPRVSADQLELFTHCPDGFVGASHGRAA